MREFYTTHHGALRRSFYRTADDQLVEALTGWQRNQWVRAGASRDPETLRRFARLQRDGTELHTGDILPPR